jgi:energy-coupling factor transporter ATP-binding protein EcfA2
MRISRLHVKNYRTLQDLDLSFPSFYTAICGRNDSGKTNVVRALRGIMGEESPYRWRAGIEVSVKDDFTKWINQELKDRRITLLIEMEVSKQADGGLYEFIVKQLSLGANGEALTVSLQLDYTGEDSTPAVNLTVAGRSYTDLSAQEVLKKLQSSYAVLFYNSTELDPRFPHGAGFGGFFRELASGYSKDVDAIKLVVDRKLRQITKGHQRQLTELLCRLESKYRVALSLSPFEIGYLPYSISLGYGKVDVGLDDWGSGTRNRTLILLTLFRARQITESSVSASKVTPVIIVEEPESFLHPSAQAEMGKVLQGLAEEFKVQVITTTHSPYMLSLDKPESNILLERKLLYGQPQETIRVDTATENWMEPFGVALGVDKQEFAPWRDLFFSKSDAILLVEGDTDKDYFELMRKAEHGNKQLNLGGQIFAYGGKDSLKQTVLLKFIKDRYKRLFITFDLDAAADVEKSLTALGFEKAKHYWPLGIDSPGRKNIEGLLPDSVKNTVHEAHPELFDQAMNGSAEERKSARSRLKRLFYDEFLSKAVPGQEFYGKFYDAVKVINRAFA